MGQRGKREFVQILRLLEVFRAEDVLAGVREAIARGAIGFDAVKHLVLCRIERRPPRLDMTVYPYLPKVNSRHDLGQGLSRPARRSGVMSEEPQLLLAHHLKALGLPTFLREYDKLARQCAAEGVDHTLNKTLVLELARCEYIARRENVIAVGNSDPAS